MYSAHRVYPDANNPEAYVERRWWDEHPDKYYDYNPFGLDFNYNDYDYSNTVPVKGDLDYDYEKAREEIRAKDEVLRTAVDKVGMLRILKQDPWVTTISFILSQNNNIKRITGLYRKLSRQYGHEVEEGYWSFPTPEELGKATEEDLRALGVGFRAPFIIDAVRKHEILSEVDSLDFDSAMDKLQEIKGIGPKVASCILIFSYARREGFPMDTWMKQCMAKYYPGKDKSYFHPYEALSQQYLFSFMRG